MTGMRVVSLLPSATELLCEVGGASLLVGRSHECDEPASLAHVPVLTRSRLAPIGADGDSAAIDHAVRTALAEGSGLYEVDEAALRALRPDVILTQDLCEVCSVDLRTVERIAETMDPRPRIVNLNPVSIEDVFDDLLRVGEAVGLHEAAERALVALREAYWSAIDYVTPYTDGPEVAFMEWTDPIFIGGHWTPQLIETAGAHHGLNPPGARSRAVSPDELVAAGPERVIVCPCGLGLEATRTQLPALTSQRWWNKLPAVVEGGVAIVDGNRMFSRPGPRLVDAFRWLVGWINERPEVIPPGFPVEHLGPAGARAD